MRHVRITICGSFAVAWVLVCGVMCPPGIHAADREDNVIETFDVARNGDVLLLPVALGDQQYHFMVDTGGNWTTVDVSLRSQLASAGRSSGADGKSGREVYRLAASLVGKSNLPIKDDEAVCVDFSRIREVTGHDIRGTLGMSFLKAHVVHVDFDAGKLSILKTVPKSAGSEFRLSYNKWNHPLLNADIEEGETTALIVASGKVGGALSLREYYFDELMEHGRLALIGPHRVTTADGDKQFRHGRLDRFCLGEFRHEEVPVREGPQNAVGLDLLSRYIVTFDFPNGCLYLKKGSRFAEPQHFDSCGLVVSRAGAATRIDEVSEGSPADASGLQAGDQILQVDGRSASSLSLFELRSLLTTDGRRIKLDITGPSGRSQVDILLSKIKTASAKRQ